MDNYQLAKIEADKTDKKIIDLISKNENIKVEAGAGAGKTYSLHKVIDWLIANKVSDFKRQNRKIACITYTNAAVEVIKDRIGINNDVVPSTIHSFAWDNIKLFRADMLRCVKELKLIEEEEYETFNEIKYTLGVRYIDEGVLYLHHNDVIKIFSKLLDCAKFRLLIESKYAAILIDEYQDSYKEIMDKILKYFVDIKTNTQICLFGDGWQTIYQSNNACGQIDNKNLCLIGKNVNFRSAKKIVNILNNLRPELPQISAINDFDGKVFVVDCNDYQGVRRQEKIFKEDLPQSELSTRIESIEKMFIIKSETQKTLMLTHKVLASYQGYEHLLNIMGDSLKDFSNSLFIFIATIVENVFNSLENHNAVLLSEILKNRPTILNRNDKKQWNNLHEQLIEMRKRTIFDVLEVVILSQLIPIPPDIIELYKDMKKNVDKIYYNGNILDLKNVEYSEFIAAKNFSMPESIYSTEHGVKGEEYDNILFVVSRGWLSYQFDKYLTMSDIEKQKNYGAYERNRNLFYVACSRAKKRLCLLISYYVDDKFKNYLINLFGKENYFSYDEFVKKYSIDVNFI